ncbi:MAG: fluoride efflux transporter CrcB [Cyanobacteriota bacterium]
MLSRIPSGSLSRYYLSLWFAQHFGSSFPYGTLAINLSGCLVMGWFMMLAMERAEIPPEARLLLGVGFLGSYTTFSTYELDSFSLWQQHRFDISLLYWLGSALLGAVAMGIGILLGSFVEVKNGVPGSVCSSTEHLHRGIQSLAGSASLPSPLAVGS